MISAASAIDLARSDTSDSNPWPFSAPNWAVPIPNGDGSARERQPGTDDLSCKCKHHRSVTSPLDSLRQFAKALT